MKPTLDFSLSQYARTAGVLLLISFVGGGLGEFLILSRLMVSGDAAATASNIRSSEWFCGLPAGGDLRCHVSVCFLQIAEAGTQGLGSTHGFVGVSVNINLCIL